eukprot:Skav232035  [mRNA]  locus=scaffold2323:159650:161919:+ [translate_table: standard]
MTPRARRLGAGQLTEFFQDYRTLDDINSAFAEVLVLEITSGNAAEKPCIFLEGGIHSREWIATSTVLYIAGAQGALLQDSEVKSLLKDFVFTLLVPANPDAQHLKQIRFVQGWMGFWMDFADLPGISMEKCSFSTMRHPGWLRLLLGSESHVEEDPE